MERDLSLFFHGSTLNWLGGSGNTWQRCPMTKWNWNGFYSWGRKFRDDGRENLFQMFTCVLINLFPPLPSPVLSGWVWGLLTTSFFRTAKRFIAFTMKVNIKNIQGDNELGIIVIVRAHLPVKSIFLEKYIIAYETTNRHSDFSTFLLQTVYTVLVESKCTIDSHTGFRGHVPDIQQYIYIFISCVTSLGRVLLAFLASRVRHAGKEQHPIQTDVVCSKPLLLQSSRSRRRQTSHKAWYSRRSRKQEWFRDTGFLSPATAGGRNSQTRVSLTCFNSNTRYPGAHSSGLSPHLVFDNFLPEMDPLLSALKTLPSYTPRSLGHSFLSLWDISGGTTVSQSPFPHFSGLITTRVTFHLFP